MATTLPVKTYGVKYIGSKNKILHDILNTIESYTHEDKTLIDVFTGTTRVAQTFRANGWTVIASDLAWASHNYAELFLRTPHDEVTELRRLARQLDQIGEQAVCDGAGDGVGWITRTYCDVEPASGNGSPVRVWKPDNGMRADSIRDTIQDWIDSEKITEEMGRKLVALLIMALDVVDSTVGVQQAYLKQWATRASNQLCLEDRLPGDDWEVWKGPIGQFIGGDALTIEYPTASVAYVDPPYTAHSYATYYHIWDSISKWDKPEVGLKTNRRIDRVARSECHDKTMGSKWNVKKKVVDAFCRLVDRLPVRRVVISYSNEALVPIDHICKAIHELPSVDSYDVYTIDHTRNIMANIGNGADPGNHRNVVEYLLVFHKADADADADADTTSSS